MSKDIIEAQIEFEFKEGAKTVACVLIPNSEIEDCEEEKAMMLILVNGATYSGIFKGMDGEHLKLQSFCGQTTLGLELGWIHDCMVQVD